jgi:hypothetical protein
MAMGSRLEPPWEVVHTGGDHSCGSVSFAKLRKSAWCVQPRCLVLAIILDGPQSARDHCLLGTRVATMPSGSGERYDFFLSRRGSVAAIAQEVTDVLKQSGYRVLTQDYDIPLTANFIGEMHEAVTSNDLRDRWTCYGLMHRQTDA